MLSVIEGRDFLSKGLRILGIVRQSLVINSINLMTATAISNVGGFVFWLLAARLYTTESVGLASALTSSVTLVASLASLGLGFGIVHFHASAKNNALEVIHACMTITVLLSLLFGCIYLVGLPWWSPALAPLPGGGLTAVLFLLIAVLSNVGVLVSYIFMAIRHTGYLLVQNIANGIVRVTLVVVATTFGVLGILSALAGSVVISVSLALVFFLPSVCAGYVPRLSLNWSPVRPLLKYAVANHASALLWGLPGSLLPLIVVNYFGATSTAHFFIVWSMAALIWAVPMAVSNSLFAEGSADVTRLRGHLRQALWLSAGLVAAPVAIAILIGDKFLSFFGTSYAQEGTLLLQILSITSFPSILVYGYLGVLRVHRKLRELCFVTALVAFGGPTLAFILMPSAGLLSVALGHALALSLTGVVSAVRMRAMRLI